MTHIPDEAVQAAKKAVSERCKRTYLTSDQMFAALAAALPHLSATCAEKLVDVSAVRRQAFEDAAKTLDDLVYYWKSLPSFNRAYAMRSTIKTAADLRALSAEPAHSGRKYKLGDRLTKTKGSKWTGRVVGFYSTNLTPIGYAIESETETGSVQIYPEAALILAHSVDAGRAALAQGGGE